MRFISIILISILTFTNCKDECENDNVKLGDIAFADTTLLYLDYYSNNQSVQFQSSDGEIKEFEITLQESGNPRLCVEVLCRPTYELDGLNGCRYYNADDRYFLLQSEDLFLHLKAGIEMYLPETELFYDYLELGLTEEFDSYFAGIVTNSSFTNPSIDTLSTILNAKLSFMENDTLGGFQDVWVYKKENEFDFIYLILDQEKGIIQFKYDGEIWTLVE